MTEYEIGNSIINWHLMRTYSRNNHIAVKLRALYAERTVDCHREKSRVSKEKRNKYKCSHLSDLKAQRNLVKTIKQG